MKHFLFEEKEYRPGASFKKRRNTEDSARALARVIRRGKGQAHGNPRRTGLSAKIFNKYFTGLKNKAPDRRQNCVAKLQYSTSKDAHRVQLEQYLTREGTAQDGSKAVLYGSDLEEYKKNMVDKNFRIFLSPQSDKINLTELANTFIKKLELQTGLKLYWQAANHYNTAHPHAHLLINGKDKNGNEVKFSKDLVKTYMREISRDLCTAQIGKRTLQEIALDKERQLTVSRFTRLDEKIRDLTDTLGRIDLTNAGKDNKKIIVRLDYLRQIKICTFSKGYYTVTKTWEETLKTNGRYNSFLKAREELVLCNN